MCAKKDKETYKIMSSFGLDQQPCQRHACVAAFQFLYRFFLKAIQSDAPVIVTFAQIFAFLKKPVFKIELGGNRFGSRRTAASIWKDVIMTLGDKAEFLGNIMLSDVPALDGGRWGLIMLEKICRA